MKSPSTIVLHCNDPKIDREGDTGRTKERQDRWRAMEMGAKRDREMSKRDGKRLRDALGKTALVKLIAFVNIAQNYQKYMKISKLSFQIIETEASYRNYRSKSSKLKLVIETIAPNHRNWS